MRKTKRVVITFFIIITSFYYFRVRYVSLPILKSISKSYHPDNNGKTSIYVIKGNIGRYDSIYIFQDYYGFLSCKNSGKIDSNTKKMVMEFYNKHNFFRKTDLVFDAMDREFYNLFIGYRDQKAIIKLIPNEYYDVKLVNEGIKLKKGKSYKYCIWGYSNFIITTKEVSFY